MAQQNLQAHWPKNIQHLSNDGHSGNSSNNIQQPISSVQSTTETQCIESMTNATNLNVVRRLLCEDSGASILKRDRRYYTMIQRAQFKMYHDYHQIRIKRGKY
eukprot:416992_1